MRRTARRTCTTDGSPVWSDAGELHGTSPARITFLRKLLEKTGTTGLMAADNPYYLNAGNPGELISITLTTTAWASTSFRCRRT